MEFQSTDRRDPDSSLPLCNNYRLASAEDLTDSLGTTGRGVAVEEEAFFEEVGVGGARVRTVIVLASGAIRGADAVTQLFVCASRTNLRSRMRIDSRTKGRRFLRCGASDSSFVELIRSESNRRYDRSRNGGSIIGIVDAVP